MIGLFAFASVLDHRPISHQALTRWVVDRIQNRIAEALGADLRQEFAVCLDPDAVVFGFDGYGLIRFGALQAVTEGVNQRTVPDRFSFCGFNFSEV